MFELDVVCLGQKYYKICQFIVRFISANISSRVFPSSLNKQSLNRIFVKASLLFSIIALASFLIVGSQPSLFLNLSHYFRDFTMVIQRNVKLRLKRWAVLHRFALTSMRYFAVFTNIQNFLFSCVVSFQISGLTSMSIFDISGQHYVWTMLK